MNPCNRPEGHTGRCRNAEGRSQIDALRTLAASQRAALVNSEGIGR